MAEVTTAGAEVSDIDAPIDVQTVSLMGTYRVGFLPPVAGSLAAGEMYLEVGDPNSAPVLPKLWVGGMGGTLATLATGTAPAAASSHRSTPEPVADQRRK